MIVLIARQDGLHQYSLPPCRRQNETGYRADWHGFQRDGGGESSRVLSGAVNVDVHDAGKNRLGCIDIVVLGYDDATPEWGLIGLIAAIGYAPRANTPPVVGGLQLVPIE
ncbi:hypothetical protein D3C71_1634430 [compost metagenome]